jgi:hypothetical protein
MTQGSGEREATEGRSGGRERRSVQQKAEVVLRLLRGEDLVDVSREVRVPPPQLGEWRRRFLETGNQGLRRRGGDPSERELLRTSGLHSGGLSNTGFLERGHTPRSLDLPLRVKAQTGPGALVVAPVSHPRHGEGSNIPRTVVTI